MGTQISWKFLHQFKQKNKSHHCCVVPENHSVVELWMRCFLKHTKLYWLTMCVWTEISRTDWKWEPSWHRIGKWCIYNMWIDIWNIRGQIEDARTSIFLTFLWGRVSLLISKTGCGDWFCQFWDIQLYMQYTYIHTTRESTVIWITIIMTSKTTYNMLYVFI